MTAEPRDVEDWCGSPESHEPHPGCSGWPSAEARDFIETAKILAEPYNEKIAALEVRLAAADRENAELRGEVERLTEAASAAYRAGGAAAQAQLAEVQREYDRYRDEAMAFVRKADQNEGARARAEAAEARLEAVRALHYAFEHPRGDGRKICIEDEQHWPCDTDLALSAALSAAPQPEPVDDEPPLSDYHRISAEMRRVGYDNLSDGDRAWVDEFRAPSLPVEVRVMTRPDATLDQLRTLIDLANERHLHDAEQWLRERVEAEFDPNITFVRTPKNVRRYAIRPVDGIR